jgi:hypothetical protein
MRFVSKLTLVNYWEVSFINSSVFYSFVDTNHTVDVLSESSVTNYHFFLFLLSHTMQYPGPKTIGASTCYSARYAIS